MNSNLTISSDCDDFGKLSNASIVRIDDSGTPFFNVDGLVDRFLLYASVVILLTTLIIGGVGNSVVIALVCTCKKLRIPPNIQLVSLAVVDLLVCVIFAPVRLHSTLSALRGSYQICSSLTRVLCSVQLFGFNASIAASLASLITISVTRAVVIAGNLSARRQSCLVAACIAASCSFGLGYGYYTTAQGSARTCLRFFAREGAVEQSVSGVLPVLILVGSFVITLSYLKIYCLTKQAVAAVHAHSDGASYSGRNIATTRICVTIVVAFVVLYMPFTITYFLNLVTTKYRGRDPFQVHFFYSVGFMGSAINPVVYTLRSTVMRRALRKVLRRQNNNQVNPNTNDGVFPHSSTTSGQLSRHTTREDHL